MIILFKTIFFSLDGQVIPLLKSIECSIFVLPRMLKCHKHLWFFLSWLSFPSFSSKLPCYPTSIHLLSYNACLQFDCYTCQWLSSLYIKIYELSTYGYFHTNSNWGGVTFKYIFHRKVSLFTISGYKHGVKQYYLPHLFNTFMLFPSSFRDQSSKQKFTFIPPIRFFYQGYPINIANDGIEGTQTHVFFLSLPTMNGSSKLEEFLFEKDILFLPQASVEWMWT